jgi:hypothetical protein
MPLSTKDPLGHLKYQGYTTIGLAMTIRNRGRAATTVERYALCLEDGTKFSWEPGAEAMLGLPALPHRLEPSASVTFFMAFENAYPYIALNFAQGRAAKPCLSGWMTAELGNGKPVETKARVPIEAPAEMVERARLVVAAKRAEA